MDGRIQGPIQDYLKNSFDVKYVDTITEPGPCGIIAENKDKNAIDSILRRVKISVDIHKSNLIAISGHYDCAGNPCAEKIQKEQIKQSIEYLKNLYPGVEVIGLELERHLQVGRALLVHPPHAQDASQVCRRVRPSGTCCSYRSRTLPRSAPARRPARR